MNVNEECLLKFLNNPGRLELITEELRRTIIPKNDNISLNNKNLKERFKLINAQ